MVIERKGELAVQSGDKGRSVFFVEMRQNLDIDPGAETVTAPDQGVAQFPVIVDLAVTDNGDCISLVSDRLLAAFQIDNRKPAKAKCETWFRDDGLTVRPRCARALVMRWRSDMSKSAEAPGRCNPTKPHIPRIPRRE